jgi:tartrate-resistant acid phosphatase type 5
MMVCKGNKIFPIVLLIILLLVGCNDYPLPATPTLTTRPTILPSKSPSATPFQPSPIPSATDFPTETHLPSATSTLTATVTPVPQPLRFAVIGDYGSGGPFEEQVAELIKSWDPQLIITVGDNNYPDGSAETIDQHIGQFFHEFIAPYSGVYGPGSEVNRFFPSLGNHDWYTNQAQPYLEYFTLPGNERYYSFKRGPAHFFALDSDSREPDGVGRSSTQAAWLQEQLAASESPWKIVYFHHSPYSSGLHGPVDWMQWPFAEWGAHFVITGHDHTYERISREEITYFVNGLGGAAIYTFIIPTEGSQVRYNDQYGAMLVEAEERTIRFQFINLQGTIIDDFQVSKP